MSHHQIHVCTGRSCRIFGAERFLTYIRHLVGLSGLTEHDTVEVTTCMCTGHCSQAPNIYIDDIHMPNVDEEKIEKHIHEMKDSITLTDENEKDRMCCPEEKRTGTIPDADDVIDANNFLGDL